MSGEEEKEKGKEEKEKDVVEMLVEELRLLRMAIQAHTNALYFLAVVATGGRYRYRGGSYGGYSYRGGRRGGKRYGHFKNT